MFKRMANALGKPFGLNPFPRAFANPVVRSPDRRLAFNSIYISRGWGAGESRSGPGSDAARARDYAGQLRHLLLRRKMHRIFDAPCGDLNWILPAVQGLEYIGGDIAPALIADLRQKHPELDLRQFDLCSDRFPAVDVWHCRDCLFHLPLADVSAVLDNFARSGVRYALITTHRSRWRHRNLDIPVGGWRYLDLEKAPFNLPRPRLYLKDFRPGLEFPRYVGLWTRDQIRLRSVTEERVRIVKRSPRT